MTAHDFKVYLLREQVHHLMDTVNLKLLVKQVQLVSR